MRVWLRDELFEHGVIHTVAQDARKVASVAAVAAVTELRCGVERGASLVDAWHSVALRSLGWSPDEALLFWELFNEFRDTAAAAAAAATGGSAVSGSPHAAGALPSLIEAALFLMVQVYVKGSADAPAKAEANASWPSPASSTDTASPATSSHSMSPLSPQSPRGIGLQKRPTENARRIRFVKGLFPDVAVALWGSEDSAGAVGADDIDALGFLFVGGATIAGFAPRLSVLTPWYGIGSATVSGGGSRPATAVTVVEWLLGHLGVNELAYPPLHAARSLAVAVPLSPVPVSPSSPGSGGFAPSSAAPPTTAAAPSAPGVEHAAAVPGPGEVPVARPVVVSGLHRATVYRVAEHGEPAPELVDVRVDSCQEAFVYVLLPVRFVSVVACCQCTIVVGAAAASVLVELCENVRVVVACRRVRVANCTDCTFFVYAMSRPVLQGDCRDIQLAPHCAQYIGMRKHILDAGLPLRRGSGSSGGRERRDSGEWRNRWSEPLVLPMASAGGVGDDDKEAGEGGSHRHVPYRLFPVELYEAMTVPALSPTADPMDDFLPLPEEYRTALSTRRESVRRLRHEIRDAGLSDDGKRELQGAVQALFKDWLVSSGHIREVADLVRMSRDVSGSSASNDDVPRLSTPPPRRSEP